MSEQRRSDVEVEVTFVMESDDPEHAMGLSSHTYERVNSAITSLGGYDIEFEKVETASTPVELPKKFKPKKEV